MGSIADPLAAEIQTAIHILDERCLTLSSTWLSSLKSNARFDLLSSLRVPVVPMTKYQRIRSKSFTNARIAFQLQQFQRACDILLSLPKNQWTNNEMYLYSMSRFMLIQEKSLFTRIHDLQENGLMSELNHMKQPTPSHLSTSHMAPSSLAPSFTRSLNRSRTYSSTHTLIHSFSHLRGLQRAPKCVSDDQMDKHSNTHSPSTLLTPEISSYQTVVPTVSHMSYQDGSSSLSLDQPTSASVHDMSVMSDEDSFTYFPTIKLPAKQPSATSSPIHPSRIMNHSGNSKNSENSESINEFDEMRELDILRQEMMSEMTNDRLMDCFVYFVLGMVCGRMNDDVQAMTFLLLCVKEFPYIWSAWLELVALTHSPSLFQYILNNCGKHWMNDLFNIVAANDIHYTNSQLALIESLSLFFVNSPIVIAEKAILYHNNSNYSQAKGVFEEMSLSDLLGSDRASEYYALTLYKLRESVSFASFVTHFTHSLTHSPTAYFVSGTYCYMKGMNERACDYFNSVLLLNNRHSLTYSLLSQVYLELYQKMSAYECLSLAESIHSCTHSLTHSITHSLNCYQFGVLSELLGDTVFASRKYEKACFLRHMDYHSLESLGECFNSRGKHELAKKCFEMSECVLGNESNLLSERVSGGVSAKRLYFYWKNEMSSLHHRLDGSVSDQLADQVSDQVSNGRKDDVCMEVKGTSVASMSSMNNTSTQSTSTPILHLKDEAQIMAAFYAEQVLLRNHCVIDDDDSMSAAAFLLDFFQSKDRVLNHSLTRSSGTASLSAVDQLSVVALKRMIAESGRNSF